MKLIAPKMKTRVRICLALLLGASGVFRAGAEEAADTAERVCPLTSTYGIEAGWARDFNTYLSPIRHTGTRIGVYGEWGRSMGFNPDEWFGLGEARIAMDFLENKQGSSSMTNIDFSGAWAMYRRFRPFPGVMAGLGAGIDFDAGALYLPRNSNNPVAARVAGSLSLNAMAAWNLRIGRMPVRLLGRVALPSLGVFFSPQYGESYYEIYLGNHDGLAHFGWWGNHFALSAAFGAEFRLLSVRWRLSYRFDCRSSYVNHINTRLVSHTIGLGITADWLNITRSHKSAARLVPMIDP